MTKNDIDNAAADHSFPSSHQFHSGNSTLQNSPMCQDFTLRNKSLYKLGMLLPNLGFDILPGGTDFDLYPGYCDGGVLLSRITEKKR